MVTLRIQLEEAQVVRQEQVPALQPGRRRRHAGAPGAKQEEEAQAGAGAEQEEVQAAEATGGRVKIPTPRRF